MRCAANKRRLFDSLTPKGITHVTVTFEGCGAHSRIDGISAWSGETPVEFPDTAITMVVLTRIRIGVEMRRLSLPEGVKLLAHDFLSDLQADGENAANTRGTFCFDAAADAIQVETLACDRRQARPATASRSLPPSDPSPIRQA